MNETTQPGPLEVRLSDQLGPEERAKLDALLDHIYEYGTTAEGVLLRAAQLCQAARAAERERCARAVVDYSLSFSFDENDRDLFFECAQYVRTGLLPKA